MCCKCNSSEHLEEKLQSKAVATCRPGKGASTLAPPCLNLTKALWHQLANALATLANLRIRKKYRLPRLSSTSGPRVKTLMPACLSCSLSLARPRPSVLHVGQCRRRPALAVARPACSRRLSCTGFLESEHGLAGKKRFSC